MKFATFKAQRIDNNEWVEGVYYIDQRDLKNPKYYIITNKNYKFEVNPKTKIKIKEKE